MKRNISLALPLLIFLAACATLGYEAPQNLSDRISYATSAADGVVVSATNALAAHTISSTDAQFVSNSGRSLSALVAAAAADPDPKSAEGRVALAEGILRQLQAYVAAHQVQK